jgi:hypothetical protein
MRRRRGTYAAALVNGMGLSLMMSMDILHLAMGCELLRGAA